MMDLKPYLPGKDFIFPKMESWLSVSTPFRQSGLIRGSGFTGICKQAVLCHVCAKALESGKLTFSKNTEAFFVNCGFQNWKDATRIFLAHELSI